MAAAVKHSGKYNYRVTRHDFDGAAKQGMQHNHAINSFKKHVLEMMQEGYTEVDAIGLWMQHVQQQADQKLSVSVG